MQVETSAMLLQRCTPCSKCSTKTEVGTTATGATVVRTAVSIGAVVAGAMVAAGARVAAGATVASGATVSVGSTVGTGAAVTSAGSVVVAGARVASGSGVPTVSSGFVTTGGTAAEPAVEPVFPDPPPLMFTSGQSWMEHEDRSTRTKKPTGQARNQSTEPSTVGATTTALETVAALAEIAAACRRNSPHIQNQMLPASVWLLSSGYCSNRRDVVDSRTGKVHLKITGRTKRKNPRKVVDMIRSIHASLVCSFYRRIKNCSRPLHLTCQTCATRP